MSGKKGCEVLAVLNSNKNIINSQTSQTNKEIDNNLLKCSQIIKEVNNDIKSIESINLKKEDISISFYKNYNDEIISLKSGLELLAEDEINLIKKRNNEIDENIQDIINKCDQLRSQVGNHYQDSNYNIAKSYQISLNELQREKQRLNTDLNNSIYNFLERKKDIKDILSKANLVVLDYNGMIEKEKIKRDSISFKNSIDKLFSEINKEYANKIDSNRFNQFKKIVDNFHQLDDTAVLQEFDDIHKKLSTYKTEIDDEYNFYCSEKERVATLWQSFTNDVTETKYYNYDDESKKLSIFGFNNKYNNKGYSYSKYEELINLCNSSISSDNFNEFDKSYRVLSDLVNKLKEETIEYERKIYKNQDNAKILLKSGKDIYATARNIDTIAPNHNPIDGFRITITVGDEVMEFDSNTDLDGNVKLDLNHVTKAGFDANNCKHTLEDFKKAANNNGLPLDDITKNGISIFSGKEMSASKTEKDNDKQRNR